MENHTVSLYRKWRPKIFDDIIGQEHITITLKNQIANNRIAHAYLLCGTRGTGKTTSAKVMAKAINCLNPTNGNPCNCCSNCKEIDKNTSLDVIELDAASNNGVDKIRDIIEEVKYPPKNSKYKIYILDEVHMLSLGAVNAFLKTLEEPPSNVIFILATTDPQKLPITILSRCQKFDFKRIGIEQLINRLKYISNEEGIVIEDKSLELISRVSDGAMRDCLSILDQAQAMSDNKNVEYAALLKMLGLVTNINLLELTDSIIKKNITEGMIIVDRIFKEGKDMLLLTKELTKHFRNLLMLKVSNKPEEVIDMSLDNLETLKQQGSNIRIEDIMRNIKILQECEQLSKVSKQARLYLELALVKMCKKEYDTSKEVILSRINDLRNDMEQIKGKLTNLNIVESNINESNSLNSTSSDTINQLALLNYLRCNRHMKLYSYLVPANISKNSNTLIVEFKQEYVLSKEKLQTPKMIELLKEIVNREFSMDITHINVIQEEEYIDEDLIEVQDEDSPFQ